MTGRTCVLTIHYHVLQTILKNLPVQRFLFVQGFYVEELLFDSFHNG